MRKVYSFVTYNKVLLLCLFLLSNLLATSQTDISIGTGTAGNANTTYPCPMQDYFEGSRMQYLYRASELTAAGMGPGTINAIKYNVISLATSTNTNFEIQNYTIKIGGTTVTTLGTATWEPAAASTVYGPFNYLPVVGINTFTFVTPFFWNGVDNILIEVCNGDPANNTGTFFTGNCVVPWTTGLSFNGSHSYRADDLGNLCGTATTTNTGTQTTRPNIIFNWTAAGPCAGTPNAGTAVSSANNVCSGQSFDLSATGVTAATGLTYQWQSSSDNSNWSNIVGATSISYTATQTASTYYRLRVTCSNGGAFENSVSVLVTSPALVSGTFTINSTLPTGGSNFASFNDAYNYIKCGINGAVIFNVASGTGPYNEQLIMTPVPGASAANTITFNGNGATMAFNSANTDERAVIKLNDADYVTFDSLNINASGGTYGFGVHLINNADFNTIRKCVINANLTTTSTNFAGIVVSGSGSSATTTGSLCDNNTIDANTVNGGYYGITLLGTTTSAATLITQNKITNNTVNDFYLYGIYITGATQTLIERNNIQRPNRTASGTTIYGIYVTGLNTRLNINANRVHNPFGSMMTTANDIYGIYLTGVDATAGNENIISNNLIYDINGDGIIYGIYNASSDNARYFHNTISLDHTTSTSTAVTRGFYQLTTATGIQLRNNIITIRRGGTGTKHAIYMGTTATTYTSNYNNFFVATAATNYVGYNGTNQATLANWQTATTQDANSLSVDPQYLDPNSGYYFPNNAALDNKGTPVGIAADILNLSRSATTPDIGAFEFAPVVCTDPPVPGTITTTQNPVCIGIPFTLGFTGGSIGSGQTYQWQSSPDNSTWTNIPGATNTTLTTTQAATTYYRLVFTCGTSVPSASLQITTPTGLAGTYTINSGVPTGGTNFQSFNAAYAAMSCGISAAVVFDVVAATGPYNEQLIMQEVPGASAINTVTFNGNGNTISYLSTNTNERAVIKLNGADHITFNNLIINATASTTSEYGWGIQLMNDADSNTVRNCQININTASTSTQYAGIVVSSSATSATTGSSLCDGNTFDGNTITGGYYGVTLMGSSTLFASYNKITRNTIKEFYLYGIYSSGSFQALVDSNMISRPTRATVSTFNGIYFTGLAASARVSRNTITNPFGGVPASTSAFNGIYFTGSDPLTQTANIVSNNLIYNLTGNGDVTALYNSSSDNVWYYHNTVVLDGDAAATTTTNFTRGFYQTTVAAGLEFKNNVITISRGGLSGKHAMYFNTAGLDIVSNNNDFFISSTTGNNNVGFVNGSDQPILANWQNASLQDANSISNDPLYTNPATGDYKPTNVALNDIGAAAGITIDILGAPRSATTPDPGAYEFAPPVCVSPPTAGAASVSETPVCENTLVALSVAGHSTGSGQTYQWQASANIAGPYANISPVLSNPSFTVTADETIYYRVAVTCTGNTAYSTPVLLSVVPGLPGGIYTIDQTQPASPTNFISFNAAKDAMACGITGPVTFNVEPNTGPYLEQVVFDTIPGASASNTVTFNGNGNIIRFSSNTSAERAVIKLIRTDHFTFDSLTIDATGAGTYGWGVQLMNNADSNTIRRCTILANTTSTSTNYAGIVVSSSATSATTGSALADANTFDANTINGGYYGITVMGTTALPIQRNKITRNTISDYYLYGVYVAGNNALQIDGNRFTRPARDNSSTTIYGVYFTGVTTNSKVNANRIYNLFGGMPTTTNDMIGIYFTGVDAVAAEANVVSNNALYNLTGNGIIYGIQNAGSNFVKYYHNTISIDNTASTSTEAARGFYQLTDADGIDFRNNIVTISRGGTGTKHAIYMGTSTTVYQSDKNDLFVETSANNHVGYNGANRTTLADWQTASSQDAASVSVTAQYTNPVSGDLRPQQGLLDNIGLPLGITTDITGAARSASTPDIGAFEFAVTPCTAPPVAGTSTVTPASGICIGETVTLNLAGNSTGGFQTYKWQRGPSATGPWTDISGLLFSPEFTHTLSSADSWFRAVVTCSGNSQNSTPVQVLLNPPLLAGDYTIDPANPPSSTNFQSFAAAVTALECGIAGSVRFHAVPGTYTEQIRMTEVPGASATSTVTFLSQNGNPASVILTFNSTVAANNYTLKLDSASFITYKNMTIAATNATNGRAIELAGTASSDSITNCIINVPAASSTSTAVVGIFATGITGSDNVINKNTVTNGSSGIYLSGTTLVSNRFVVDSNVVSNAYQYGIYTANINRIKVNKNIVDRSGLMNTTAYGIYLTNCDSAYQVNNNKVDISNSGVTVYGIYMMGSQSDFASLGSISNNKVVGGAANTGTQYGIYLTTSTLANARNNVVVTNTSGATSYGVYITGTGGINFQNNSVQSAATSATNNVAAYFSQTSGANGAVNIRNNIFSHTGGGRAMYIVNPQFIYSDYNMFYTTGSTLVQWGTAGLLPTLQRWRDTAYWDFNSIVYQPAFVSTTDLTPNVASPDVWAIHGRGEQIVGNNTDINNNPRPTTLTAGVPDLGAYEFVPTSVPVALTAVPATPIANSTQTFMLGTDTVTKISWGAAVPTTITGKRYSGAVPPGLVAGQDYMYFYTDFDITGTTPTGHTVKQFYIDPWRGFISSEPVIKLGRTNASNVWQVSAGSTVNIFDNTIQESNLTLVDKYTGLTDGLIVPPPPIVVNPSDSSNRGRKFWVGYGHHQDFGGGNAQEMVLYLGAGSTPANVTVRVNGTAWVKTYSVPANSVISSDFMPKFGLFDARLTAEGLSERSISIDSDVPITAYAHIYGNTNSGATMLMPIGAYGFEYYAITSKQNYAANTYSWVNVIAPYDSTVVEITPSKPTLNGRPAGVPFTVSLKKGEAYQVLGAIISGSDGYDLTGTKVRSIPNSNGKCYPVAVFSGSSRTNLGCSGNNPTGSGDNIIQQNFPFRAWGRRYLTAPTSASTAANVLHTNIYKVAVKDPTTVVKRNGVTLTGLIDNLYYQFEGNTADYIEADKPVMVAQFIPSQGGNAACGNVGVLDPEMIYISPVEQGIKNVALYRNTEFNITTQYLTLIIPTAGVTSLLVDGSNTFDYTYAHPNLPGYSVVVKRWGTATNGQTVVTSDSAFTAITYGLGSAESYGYNAGTLIKNLNLLPSINNVFNTSGTANTYTCVGTPFTVSFLSTVQPNSIEWNFSQVPNLTPNANVVQNNPTPAGSVVINGVTYYRYTLATQYVFSATGTYNVPVFVTHPEVEGCNNRMETSIPITVIGSPTVDFNNNLQACPNTVVQFNGTGSTVNNTPITTWNWNFGDNTTGAVQNPTHTYTAAGTYNVQLGIIAAEGCIANVTKPVVVGLGPVVNIVPDSVGACTGDNVTFNVQNPVAGAVYSWFTTATGGTPVATGTSYTITNITTAVSYYVESSVNGCPSLVRKRVQVTVRPPLATPTAIVDTVGTNMVRFRWSAVPGATGYEVTINGGTSWITPSSGATGLTHTVTGLTVGQTVTLRVRALGGCQLVTSAAVSATTVTDQVYIPNAFTPNGDGLNDVLRVYSNIIRSMRFTVFNQWGEKIFESTSQTVAWDGTHKNKPQPSGVYMYVCDIILQDGSRIQRKGAINLVR